MTKCRFYKLNIEHDFERKLDDLVTEFLKELTRNMITSQDTSTVTMMRPVTP